MEDERLDLRKGLSYVAFGFLFTLVDLNINADSLSVNLLPDFVGWLLLFFGCGKLGHYLDGKGFLRWISVLLALASVVGWAAALNGALPTWFDIICSVCSLVFSYVLFGVLEHIARDFGSGLETRIRLLKLFLLVCNAGITFYPLLGVGEAAGTVNLVVLLGVVGLIAAIIACVTLFQLRSEIRWKLDHPE